MLVAGDSAGSLAIRMFDMNDSDNQFDQLSHQLSLLMDELANQNFFRLVSSDAWEPEVNIYEAPGRFLICAELAGMRSDEIDVSIERGAITISGHRPQPVVPKSDDADGEESLSIQIMEINAGRFERRIAIAGDVDVKNITATYRNGFLWLIAPKMGTKSMDEA